MPRYFLFICILFLSFYGNSQTILTGLDQTEKYLPLLKNKKIGIVCNHSAIFHNGVHMVDSFIKLQLSIKKIFAPEHGFRGDVPAGDWISHTIDEKTGLPIISLYGKNKKPTPEELKDIDLMIYDIQDVGVRFYTYISTLHYVMEACAEQQIPLIIFDRPNPLGFYVDGPVLDTTYRSFVGMHPVPIVYGMTVAEYAQMINGEQWLKNGVRCSLTIIPLTAYTHQTRYQLPIKPSPSLVNMQSVYLYPSLCLFEGTVISVARGTDFPFQAIGHPLLKGKYSFSFQIPATIGNKKILYTKTCYGLDLRNATDSIFTLKYVIELYHQYPKKEEFFNSFFIKLIGNKKVFDAIKQGKKEYEIKQMWKKDIEQFLQIRQKYLLYP
ncbi:MAG: DUF1343 domain-containing protein [Bacteroidales bacterium]|nr:DUF1343 domain-containing protein [Bacteroidales bacterium]